MAKLERENEDLLRERDDLKRQLEGLQCEKTSLGHKLAKKEGDYNEALAKVARLQHTEATFRDIILDKAGTQKVSDTEIRDFFLAVRQKTQAISNNRAYDIYQDACIPRKATTEVANFYDSWRNYSIKERRQRMMSKIFDQLGTYILDYRCFGLEGHLIRDKGVENDIEHQLCLFEKHLEEGIGKSLPYFLFYSK